MIENPDVLAMIVIAVLYLSGIALLRSRWNRKEVEEKNSMKYGE